MIRKAAEMCNEVRENMRGGPGAVAIRHLFTSDEIQAKTRLCARLIIPPGAGIGPHRHEQEDELFVVIGGEGVVEEDGRAVRVAAGDAVLTGRGGSHAVRNEGGEPLEMLAVIMCYA